MSSVENLPGYEEVEEVGVGVVVVYHTRVGNQRQGRTTFPAMVLQQHPDDGTLELLVFFEPEDILWERRVPRWTEEQPGRCWEPVQQPETVSAAAIAEFTGRLARIEAAMVDSKSNLGSDESVETETEQPRQKRAYNRRVKPESAGKVGEE